MEGKIYEAIAAVMADVGAVGKDATNTFDKYKYRSIDAVMNAMHPAMVKHGVFVTPEVIDQTRAEREGKNGTLMIYSVTKVKYTFFADDGSSVQAVVIGEGSDRGDKSMNKAMSAAFKYALFQVFCLPTAEMIDSETDSPELMPKKQPEKQPDPQYIGQTELKVMEAILTNHGYIPGEKYSTWPKITQTQYAACMEHFRKLDKEGQK